MAATPFIKPITTNKGVMYSFQSAIDDISSTFNRDSKKFAFSKFALLKIPEMGTPESVAQNKIQFLAPGETSIIDGLLSQSNYNLNLAESFQNYALNMESLLLSRDGFRPSAKRTVAERVFWKWMRELGAVRFREANILNERDPSVTDEPRFVENDESSGYEHVVKYMGEIDAINSVRGINAHTEVYIYVPTDAGSAPRVMFDSVSDDNYGPNMRVLNGVNDPLNVEYIAGRGPGDTHPFGLRLNAFYDLDSSAATTEMSESLDPTDPDYVQTNWFNYNTLNAYYTEPEFGSVKNMLVRKTYDARQVEYIRNSLDGAVLDWDLANYRMANDMGGINTFSQFARTAGNDSVNFEYNALLLYYDIYEPSANPATPPVKTTNLFGVLFLNECVDGGTGSDFNIPTTLKYKPDPVSKTNGNALAYKLNVKYDSSINESAVDRSVNDHNTWGMDLYMDALAQMQRMTEVYSDNIGYLLETRDMAEGVKGLLMNDADRREIMAGINELRGAVSAAGSMFESNDTLLSMIRDLNKKYNDILDNKTEVVVHNRIDPAVLNSMITRNQAYNLPVGDYYGDVAAGSTYTVKLRRYTNYFKHISPSPRIAGGNLTLFLDDSETPWSNGQVLRLAFQSPLDLDVFNLTVKTDARAVMGTAYGRTVAVLGSVDFSESGNTPYFEIICVDAGDLVFDYNKIR